jgi:hypothetical protein
LRGEGEEEDAGDKGTIVQHDCEDERVDRKVRWLWVEEEGREEDE